MRQGIASAARGRKKTMAQVARDLGLRTTFTALTPLHGAVLFEGPG